jgi:glycine/D-amino acid oxidase-like deaminating enzyme
MNDPASIIGNFERSHWSQVSEPALPWPVLEGPHETEVVIIGSGFTGLSTALHLLEAGKQVTVIEAQQPGFGASGRNNGQVIPTLTRLDPDMMISQYQGAGERLADLVRDSAGMLFDLVRKHGLQAEAEQSGWIQPAHTPGRIKLSEQRFKQWEKRGAPVRMLDRADVERLTGSPIWHGGFMNDSGGHINPLAFARSMAARVKQLGGVIFARSPAQTMQYQNGFWHVQTPKGSVKAHGLLLASHSYTDAFAPDLMPDLAREVVPVLSWQMATEPLGESQRAAIIPARQAVSDTHGDLYFMRYDARHQLVTGGALVIPYRGHERLRGRIGDRLMRIFPQLHSVRFTAVWNGYIGMTSDYAPRIHRLGPNGYGWVGCNGRGVALSTALGGEFAKALAGEPLDRLALPLSEIKPLPFHGVIRRLAPVMLLDYRRRDLTEIS